MNIYGVLSLLNSQIIGGQTTQAPSGATVGDAVGAVVNAAADVAEAPADMAMSPWVWLVYPIMIVGLYFLMIRPQRKRDKQMKEMQESIRTGDNVVTTSGMYGKIVDVGEDCFVVEFGTNKGIKIPVRKSDVAGIKTPNLNPTLIDSKQDGK